MSDVDLIDIDELFPYKKDGKASYRPYQREAIVKAVNALFVSDYDIFVVDAPVGYGKSGVMVAMARIASTLGESAYLTTPQIILQEQYFDEFSEIPQIKGRSNYICADDPEVSCAEGECQIDEGYECPVKYACPYVVQRDKCLESPVCGMNTSYMMTVRKELFGTRNLFLCDEAHSISEWGVGFVSVTIRESDVGMIPVFDKGFQAYLLWLERVVYPKLKEDEKKLKERLKSFGKGKKKAVLGIMEEYKRIKDVIKKIENLSADFEEYQEEWTYDIVEDKRGKKIVFQPLTSGRFLDRILWSRGEKVVLSSGTIEPEIDIKEAGLTERDFDIEDCVISVPSEFSPEKSPIYYNPIGKMTKDNKAYTFPLLMKELNEVISKRKDRKGILHTFSYANAQYVVQNIAPELKSLLFVQDQGDRSGSLERWMDYNKPSVFVSTNMSEGLNLKGDLCRYQVYVKIGYPNTTDKRVAKRLELGHWVWYSMQAIKDLEQASGRATRSKDDWSEMFIFDASFGNLYVKYNKYFKKWFKDRLVLL